MCSSPWRWLPASPRRCWWGCAHPQDIARFEPPGLYQDWWEHVRAAAERPRGFPTVDWYEAVDGPWSTPELWEGQTVYGAWLRGRIYLARGYLLSEGR